MKLHPLTSFLVFFMMMSGFIPTLALAARLQPDQVFFYPTILADAEILTEPEVQQLQVSATGTPYSLVSTSRASDAGDAITINEEFSNTATIARYEQEIAALVHQEGRYSPTLREQYLVLASHYVKSGQAKAALNTFENAMQVARVVAGLYSLDQLPIMRNMINAYLELGDLPNAHRLQEAMLQLQVRHFGSDALEVVPALLEWADWNVNLYLSNTDQKGTVLPNISQRGKSTMDYANPYIQEAYTQYVAALMIMQEQPIAENRYLLATERKLAAVNFMVNQDMQTRLGNMSPAFNDNSASGQNDLVSERLQNFHFLNGSSALKRALAYGYLSPKPDHDYIAARMLELADWYLLFDRRGAALDLYEETLALLSESNIPQPEIDRLFAAGLPVQAPDSPYQQSADTRDYTGYIDVEFTLNKYGSASDTRLLKDTEADPEVIQELMRTIRRCKFRPKFSEGSVLNKETVKLRYFYKLNT